MSMKRSYQNSFTVAPYIRWSYYQTMRVVCSWTELLHWFCESKRRRYYKEVRVGLRPGIAVKLNDHFSFIAKYGFLGYRRNVKHSGDSFGLNLTSEDLSIGFHYAF